MKYIYGVVRETYIGKDKSRTTYGIAVMTETEEGVEFPVRAMHDCSSDLQVVTEFVALCNRLQLSPVHLDDAVDDFLF